MQVDDILVFVPCKDYAESQRFYRALGFNLEFVSDALTLVECGECRFFLQDFYNEELANNLMLQLIVFSIDDALEKISTIKDAAIRYQPIQQESWGKVIYLWGPAGELWHVTELAS